MRHPTLAERITAMMPMVILGGLAAATFWLSQMVQKEVPRAAPRHDPDYIVEGFEVRQFDAQGQLQQTAAGLRMEHYPDDDTTVVRLPRFVYLGASPLEITAEKALMGPSGKEVDLVSGVRLVRADVGDKLPTVMETAHLKLFPDEKKAHTRSPVTFTQGQSVMRGSGLDLDNVAGTTVLHGRVTGVIHRNRTR